MKYLLLVSILLSMSSFARRMALAEQGQDIKSAIQSECANNDGTIDSSITFARVGDKPTRNPLGCTIEGVVYSLDAQGEVVELRDIQRNKGPENSPPRRLGGIPTKAKIMY